MSSLLARSRHSPPEHAPRSTALGPALRASEPKRETGLVWLAERVGATAIAAVRVAFDLVGRTFDAPDGAGARAAGERAGDEAPSVEIPSTRDRIVERVHVAGVGAMPLVCVVAGGTGAAIVLQGTMAPQPPSAELGRLLVVVVLREIAPLFTALLVAGHSGPIVAAHLADALGVDRERARRCHVVGTAIAVTALAIHFAAIATAAAFLTSACVTLRTYGAVREGLLHELALFDAPLVLGKAVALGTIVGWLGLGAADEHAAGEAPGPTASRLFTRSLLAASALSVGVTLCLYAIIGAPLPP